MSCKYRVSYFPFNLKWERMCCYVFEKLVTYKKSLLIINARIWFDIHAMISRFIYENEDASFDNVKISLHVSVRSVSSHDVRMVRYHILFRWIIEYAKMTQQMYFMTYMNHIQHTTTIYDCEYSYLSVLLRFLL